MIDSARKKRLGLHTGSMENTVSPKEGAKTPDIVWQGLSNLRDTSYTDDTVGPSQRCTLSRSWPSSGSLVCNPVGFVMFVPEVNSASMQHISTRLGQDGRTYPAVPHTTEQVAHIRVPLEISVLPRSCTCINYYLIIVARQR